MSSKNYENNVNNYQIYIIGKSHNYNIIIIFFKFKFC